MVENRPEDANSNNQKDLFGGLISGGDGKDLRTKTEKELEEELRSIKEEQKRRRENELRADRLLNRAVFDMPVGMKEIIKEIADNLGTTNSQVASFLLAHAIMDYREGRIEIKSKLIPSRSPRRPFNIDIPDFRDPSDDDFLSDLTEA